MKWQDLNLKDAAAVNKLVKHLRTQEEAPALQQIREIIQKNDAVGLDIAKRALKDRSSFIALFHQGLAQANASTIKTWIEVCAPKIGDSTLLDILEELSEKNLIAVDQALYWLPDLLKDDPAITARIDRLRSPPTSALNYENFFDQLVTALPEFRPGLQDHIQGYGELIRHVCMGEFTNVFVNQFNPQNQQNDRFSFILRALRFLDKAIASRDDKVQNLVAVSFIENLQGVANYDSIKQALTPRLRRELEHFE